MEINSDFGARVVIRPDEMTYIPSPSAGVDRIMLDRIGDEVARATSIVRYAPDSSFPRHVHAGGEEYIVLDGVFSDEHGDFPAGTYVRNPIGTSHAPFTREGATILVKLWQFQNDDDEQFSVDIGATAFQPTDHADVSVLPLHTFGHERVFIEQWSPGAKVSPDRQGGEEIYILDGAFSDEDGDYPAGTWIRNPDGTSNRASWSESGARLLIKTGHLIAGSPVLRSPHDRKTG